MWSGAGYEDVSGWQSRMQGRLCRGYNFPGAPSFRGWRTALMRDISFRPRESAEGLVNCQTARMTMIIRRIEMRIFLLGPMTVGTPAQRVPVHKRVTR